MAPRPEPNATDETSNEARVRPGAAPVESTSDLDPGAVAEREEQPQPEPVSAPTWPPVSLEDER